MWTDKCCCCCVFLTHLQKTHTPLYFSRALCTLHQPTLLCEWTKSNGRAAQSPPYVLTHTHTNAIFPTTSLKWYFTWTFWEVERTESSPEKSQHFDCSLFHLPHSSSSLHLLQVTTSPPPPTTPPPPPLTPLWTTGRQSSSFSNTLFSRKSNGKKQSFHVSASDVRLRAASLVSLCAFMFWLGLVRLEWKRQWGLCSLVYLLALIYHLTETTKRSEGIYWATESKWERTTVRTAHTLAFWMWVHL